jgi:hypothetical protein
MLAEKDGAAIGLEDVRPKHEIGDARLVFQGDEYHVEGSWCDIVEAPRQPIGSVWIGPDPTLEFVLDPLKLRLRRLGVYDLEHAPLAVVVLDGSKI